MVGVRLGSFPMVVLQNEENRGCSVPPGPEEPLLEVVFHSLIALDRHEFRLPVTPSNH